ncbi:sigma-54-dependent transcriptional regulator [Aliivibrio fischeri]|uniref:sigma-54-dependent transcriptional regulator n=1 Tax=Aliivibrio fischeri TaxID=668 RepID=UPI0007C47893|nr:sigma-54 dependent transcriptional regulator [Aliivibrio fischeri]MCE7536244.1 sigma-54 dependent transcriptional regulator [Aliivibrio fischeri]MCE7559030.1 sigma-54 dependent transcriptional regulator [Aliivibrio fischeri]
MLQKVLLVEDSTSLAILYKQYVKDEPYEFFHVTTGEQAKAFMEKNPPHLVILDLKLPDMSGQDVLAWMKEKQLPTAVIIATAHGTINIAVNLLQNGADDFIEKPIQAERLKTSIANHLKRNKLEGLVEDLQNTFNRKQYQGFIGSSLPMQAVYKIIDSVAPTTASVFIYGESGTGKEVCAEAIHYQSKRSNKPFVAINCGAIPRDLMESEIFGHIKGAFTGATTDRKGAAMLANGGTLFLDELCEMELEMQKKLLRFLQTGRFTPLGGSKELSTDIRIICATNRDPLTEVNEGRFREDLYYRVHVVPIHMPPLRERGTDIIDIATFFLKKYAKEDHKKFKALKRNVELRLCNYSWPGNVRQLQNIIRNVVVLHNDTHVAIEHLPPPLNQPVTNKATPVASKPSFTAPSQLSRNMEIADVQHNQTEQQLSSSSEAQTLETSATDAINTSVIRPMADIEREVIQNAIDHCDGNVLNAAVLLELSPSTLYRKKQAWEAYEESE